MRWTGDFLVKTDGLEVGGGKQEDCAPTSAARPAMAGRRSRSPSARPSAEVAGARLGRWGGMREPPPPLAPAEHRVPPRTPRLRQPPRGGSAPTASSVGC